MSTEERMKILEMIAAGQITAEEAARLLDASSTSAAGGAAALEKPADRSAGMDRTRFAGRRLRVKVVENDGTRVNVNLPLSLMEIGLKIGGRFVDELRDIDREMEMLMDAIRNDVQGKIVEVDDEDSHVEVYIE
ncbi:MAG TPA: hypothetical protein VMN57_07140 [Anaerolineales bacterium]|nr:hypothetical protein [Anaerolineales bacterium]